MKDGTQSARGAPFRLELAEVAEVAAPDLWSLEVRVLPWPSVPDAADDDLREPNAVIK